MTLAVPVALGSDPFAAIDRSVASAAEVDGLEKVEDP